MNLKSNVVSEMKRVQYTKDDKTGSSLTIDSIIFDALDKKTGNAKKWCQDAALKIISELREEAQEKYDLGLLIKVDNLGNHTEASIDEYIKGKISAGVRKMANLEVIDPKYLK